MNRGEGVIALTNGNYVVSSSLWNDSGSPWAAGAVTWGNGRTGTVGPVSWENSLVGNINGDMVGYGGGGHFGVVALSSGNYAVPSPRWSRG